ncbi:Uncharacterized protein LSUE1_G005908 [Lachnellula suecica]|uniref:HD domain-containing protein n=1 Tax=Lachnellula suecica TaxID=602035 RepID=A0A8T9BYG9_9HELO|nr:Uncharacterized protein LSUE1_G005908 [Lachnellula suecica]
MRSQALSPELTTNNLISLLEDRGTGDYIGESISQLEHCLQCAHFGVQSGSDDETVIAALLHDIGQFLPVDAAEDVQMASGASSVGRVGHETIGEEYLKSLGFGEHVSRLVGSHISHCCRRVILPWLIKRVKAEFEISGGAFVGDELEAFECDPLKVEMVKLRQWDDSAKIPDLEKETPRASSYGKMIQKHLEKQL